VLNSKFPLAYQKEYADDIETLGLSADPLKWVMYNFPWGEPNTPLANEMGPDDWQKLILKYIRDQLSLGRVLDQVIQEAIQIAVASGHGVGKSALVSWLILWALVTFVDCKGVVTANTATQLSTKTWPELDKWHKLQLFGKELFFVAATSIHSTDPEHEKTWRVDAIPWSEHKSEAFAGLHNAGKRILIIYDEASAVADKIWEVTEGALTDADTEIIWATFGNPTRNVGRFRECWRRFRSGWKTWSVDSRTAKKANKTQIQKWIEAYGEDSDFIKIRVKGEFPSQSERQFIGSVPVEAAMKRHLNPDEYNWAPVIIGVDPAWWGGDETVIVMRQGRQADILKVLAKNDDDVFVAGLVAHYEDQYKADAVFIDQGYGTGIYSVGKNLGRTWTLISFGGAPIRKDVAYKRDEMWLLMRDWLANEGASIPDDPVLFADLTGPEYDMTLKGQVKLESKDDMKDKGLPSPNRADALALTFAMMVVKKDHDANRLPGQGPTIARTDFTVKTFTNASVKGERYNPLRRN